MVETNTNEIQNQISCRNKLDKFERSQILEVYFLRADGRTSEEYPVELTDLYELDMASIKSYLLNQHPKDPILHKLFNIMN